MTDAFICDAVRTPIGRYGGALSSIRADDLAAIPIRALIDRNPGVDWAELDDVILAAQSGWRGHAIWRAWPDCWRVFHEAGGVTLTALRLGPDAVAMAPGRNLAAKPTYHRRRVGKHEPRAVRDAQASAAFDRNAEI